MVVVERMEWMEMESESDLSPMAQAHAWRGGRERRETRDEEREEQLKFVSSSLTNHGIKQ